MAPVKNILILGGYGRVGFELAKLLLRHTNCKIRLAGRDPVKAVRAARELNSRCFEGRVSGLEVNACLKVQLVRLFEKADLVINVIPFTGPGGKIAQAALDTGIHYMDLGAGCTERDRVRLLDEKVREAGLTFITEAGLLSGTTLVMEKYLADRFEYIVSLTADGKKNFGHLKGFPAWIGQGNNGRFKRSPEICSVSVTGAGISGGVSKKLTLAVEHRDASLAAAMAAIPCILGLVEGSIRQPGVHLMGQVLDPDRYLENLWDLGMTVSLQTITEPEQVASRSGEMSLLRWHELMVY